MAKVVQVEQPFTVNARDNETYVIDCTPILDTRTVSSLAVASSTGGLSTSNAAVVSSAYTYTNPFDDRSYTVDASHAVQVDVTGFESGKNDIVRLSLTLSDSSVRGVDVSFWCRQDEA